MIYDKSKRVAILGASGHIAKNLIYYFLMENQHKLYLFARNPDKVSVFVHQANSLYETNIHLIDEFFAFQYDVVINCIGIGDPAKLRNIGNAIFSITETYDNLILDYLEKYPSTLYLNFSSGAVYGTDFRSPVNENSINEININNIKPTSYYGIAKINSEVKHRAMEELNIIDLRIFSFFSRFIDLDSQFFISQLIFCIRQSQKLITNRENIVRDFVHPLDLFQIIKLCMEQKKINTYFDVYSAKAVTKKETLDYFFDKYNLNYVSRDEITFATATGSKLNYFSTSKKAEQIGYCPVYSSIDSVIQETEALLNEAR